MKKVLGILALCLLPLAGFAKDVVSVLYFDNTSHNTNYDWFSKGIADMLITDLAQSSDLDVVDRANLQHILQEHSLVLSGVVSDNQALQLGELLAANKIIYGSFIVQGGTVRIDAKVTDASTGKILGSLNASGAAGDIFSLESDFAKKAFSALGVAVPAGMETPETTSLDAARSYYRGLNYFDAGNYDQAAALFQTSAAADPFYDKPQMGLQEAYAFLNKFREQRYQREINELIRQARDMKDRLAAPRWLTYGDLLTEFYRNGTSQEDQQAFLKLHPSYLQADTPALCTWNLQMMLMDIGSKYEEYFGDTNKMKAYYAEAIRIAGPARTTFANDPNLAEILYAELLAVRNSTDDWAKVKTLCEDLMRKYPDYRMMWAVENFYEDALDKLSRH